MEAEYISIMIQSLEKKLRVLEQIRRLNDLQKRQLKDPNLDPDDFEENINSKGELIEQLNLLDSGFERVYERVREELNNDRSKYAPQIARMQELIRKIMACGNEIGAQEERNKQQAQAKFDDVRKQVKNVRDSQKAVRQYYSSMMKNTENSPQFIDNKK